MQAQEFVALIKGKSDDEIYAALAAQSTGAAGEAVAMLEQIMANMVSAFDPAGAAGQSAVIQYDIKTPDGSQSFQLVVKDGTCSATRDCTEKPRVSLALSLPDFLRLISGNLNGQEAFFRGALKVGGDLMFSQQLERWFKRLD